MLWYIYLLVQNSTSFTWDLSKNFWLILSDCKDCFLIHSAKNFWSDHPVPNFTILQYLLTYLFTWEVVPHGPGRASQGTSAPGCSRSHPVSSRASPLGAAQLVGSQLFVGSFENLTLSQSFHFCGNLVPVLNHSQAEEISAHVQSSMSHSNVQWVSPCPGWPYAVSCHLKLCLWVQATSALKDFMDHAHISLMSPLFQGRQV